MYDSVDVSLLPGPHEAPRCAPHAEEIGLDPGGTALWVDEIVVVDLARPWPKPVWAADGFTAVPEWVMDAESAGRRVRVLASVPDLDQRHRVVVHRRGSDSGAMTRREHHATPAEIPAVLERLLLDGPDASSETLVDVAAPARELLVCAQGSHDVCCGSRGTQFALDIAAARPDVAVEQVSHTGGHRFAPTGVTLPDARMWGLIEVDEMLAVLDRSGRPSAVAPRLRGWTGAEGPGQVAERAVLEVVDDWAFDDLARSVDVEVADGGWRCTVRTEAVTWQVDVEVGRTVPTIKCGTPGGGAAKAGVEYVATAPPRVVP